MDELSGIYYEESGKHGAVCVGAWKLILPKFMAKEIVRRCKAYNPWISVSERPPLSKRFCHIFMPSVNVHSCYKGWYSGKTETWRTTLKSHLRTKKVTHWKPIVLPKLPCPSCKGSGLKTDENGVVEDDVCPECDGEKDG